MKKPNAMNYVTYINKVSMDDYKLMFYTVNIKPKQFYIEFNKINRNLDSYLHVKKDITELIDFGNFINKKKPTNKNSKNNKEKKSESKNGNSNQNTHKPETNKENKPTDYNPTGSDETNLSTNGLTINAFWILIVIIFFASACMIKSILLIRYYRIRRIRKANFNNNLTNDISPGWNKNHLKAEDFSMIEDSLYDDTISEKSGNKVANRSRIGSFEHKSISNMHSKKIEESYVSYQLSDNCDLYMNNTNNVTFRSNNNLELTTIHEYSGTPRISQKNVLTNSYQNNEDDSYKFPQDNTGNEKKSSDIGLQEPMSNRNSDINLQLEFGTQKIDTTVKGSEIGCEDDFMRYRNLKNEM